MSGELSNYRVSRLLDSEGAVICEVWLPEEPSDEDWDFVNAVLDLSRDPVIRR